MPDFFTQLAASRRDAGPPPRSVNFWLLIILLLLVLAAAIRFLGPATPDVAMVDPSVSKTPGVRVSRTYTVTYKSGVFSPTNLRIHVGDTVIFHNNDTRALRIVSQVDPESQDPYFDSTVAIAIDATFAFTFADSGIFTYHRSGSDQEAGVIIVREP